jgi:hypothetical protein
MSQIFISYSRANKGFVEDLVTFLTQRKFLTWYPKHLKGGDEWWDEILNAIERASIFIYVLSEESSKSSYCQAQLKEALRLQKRIVPIRIRAISKIPKELRSIQIVDMQSGLSGSNRTSLVETLQQYLSQNITPKKPLSDRRTPRPSAFSALARPIALTALLLMVGLLVFFWPKEQGQEDPTNVPCCVSSPTATEASDTPTVTIEASHTPTDTASPSHTPSETSTATPSISPSPTDTFTPTFTSTPTLLPVDLTIGFLLDISRNMREDLGNNRRPYSAALDSIDAILESVDAGRSNRVVLQLVGQDVFSGTVAGGSCDENNTSRFFDGLNPQTGLLEDSLRILLPRDDNMPAYETGLQAILGEVARPASDNQGYSLLFIFVGSASLEPCSDGSLDETMDFVFDTFDGETISINYCTFLLGSSYRLQGAQHDALVQQYGCVANVDEAIELGQAMVDNAEAIIDATQTPNSAPAPTSIAVARSVGKTPKPSSTPSPSFTPSYTPTISLTPSETLTPSITPTASATWTPSVTPLVSDTPSATPTASQTPSATASRTPTPTTPAPTPVPPTPVPPTPIPPTLGPCTLTVKNDQRINARSYPVYGNVVGGLDPNESREVNARMNTSSDGTWYRFGDRWVAGHLVNISGACNNIANLSYVEPPPPTPEPPPTEPPTPETVVVPDGNGNGGSNSGGGGGTGDITITGVTVHDYNGSGCPATIHFRVTGGTVTGIFWAKNSEETDPYDENGNVSFGEGEHTYGVNFGGLGLSHEVRFTGNDSTGWFGGGTCD